MRRWTKIPYGKMSINIGKGNHLSISVAIVVIQLIDRYGINNQIPEHERKMNHVLIQLTICNMAQIYHPSIVWNLRIVVQNIYA